ncbi:zinc protease [Limimaricola soesokkakensis]|uniref:Peptidase M16 inactive domain protein n=1 Tax=Limimaricola soesokkakensis TaxID=1343159 RepID=A0A1X6YJW2_9RHOB|nr:pitrilysin family protein [Limimaricola soesokkakensis]PSK88570.1 zinc protease [Limimaricola soesokkakensis]SLN23005.1 Peptidase M16 inactive domain protein [Limimaricola soesokkakensis]
MIRDICTKMGLGAALLMGLAGLARAEIEIQEVTSPGGIEAWLVEDHSIPFTALEIRFEGGTGLDDPDSLGAVNLMTGLLEEGAAEMDARAFQAAREDLAAQFGFDVGADTLSVSAKMLSENRDAAVDLLRAALVEPRFDPEAIERVRGQVQSILRQDAQNPNRIAGRAFYEAAFGDHPYGRPDNGTAESVAALTREDLLAAHEAALTREGVHVGAVGDITPDELGALLDELLGDLPASGPELPGHVEFGLSGGIDVIDYPSPQSVALFGQRGLKREDEDFFAAYVLNHILGGGGFESRLMTEVREKRGLTYGVSTDLVPLENAEFWIGSVASANDRMARAIEVIREEWARIAEEGVTQVELDDAKTYLTGEYPLRFDGNGPIAEILVGMQVTGLPQSYVTERNAFIEAVTLEEVNRVARELVDPEALHFVVVGRPEGLGEAEAEAAVPPRVTLPEVALPTE